MHSCHGQHSAAGNVGGAGRLSKEEQQAAKRHIMAFKHLVSDDAVAPLLQWLRDEGYID